MKDAGVSASQMAERLGMSYQAVKKVIDGKSSAFNAANNSAAARYLGVSTDWLATGDGPKRAGEPALAEPWVFPEIPEKDIRALPKAKLADLQETIKAAMRMMGLGIDLKPAQPIPAAPKRGGVYDAGAADDPFPTRIPGMPAPWEGGKTTLQAEREAGRLKISRDADVSADEDSGYSANDHDFVRVKELDVRLAAGRLGIENYSETQIGEIMLRRSFLESFGLPIERMRIVYAHGHSMDPIIRHRAPMLFYEDEVIDQRQIRKNVVYAINHGGDMITKCLERRRGGPWLAKSINPAPEYSPFPLDLEDGREVRIVGQILWSPYDLRNGVDPRLL